MADARETSELEGELKIESYSVICDACNGRGYDDAYVLCEKCQANGQIVVPDEKRTLQAALDGYRKWAAGFRAAVRPWMGR